MKYFGTPNNRERTPSKSPSVPSDTEDQKEVPVREFRGSKGRPDSFGTHSNVLANGQNDDVASKKSNMREVLMRVNN